MHNVNFQNIAEIQYVVVNTVKILGAKIVIEKDANYRWPNSSWENFNINTAKIL